MFERMQYGHESIAQSRWVATHGTIRYLGEWHTHPEDDPYPSGLDISEWDRLAGNRKDNRPQLAVIVGRKSLYVELVPNMEPNIVLTPID
ncbi:Mov34/MPN/PAD-1 family protein [Microbulbifer sp. VAAF005]|uniref:Mov34/MPN/PAD-1 family protein n=1 Tax=Microbulbifer sp. VAAF005 TaxID=3034230 RepID=UPI0024AD1218|nr:Mov34/MPN/PAD-1 family protein [Microbulbifer sp. VAAF005]WHI44621.1 Mov34/MPN/PAD-1 family protein [Microbulbifer sp. VAAF005]